MRDRELHGEAGDMITHRGSNMQSLKDLIRSIEIYDKIDTTMEHPPPLQPGATMALEQTSGRGRTGPWISRRGGLWITIHIPGAEPPPALPVAIGGCLAHRLNTLAQGAGIKVKWPNDLLIGTQKLAGILVEEKHGALRIGIGINIYNKPPPGAISLHQLGYRGSIADTAAEAARAVLDALTDTSHCIHHARRLDALKGCHVAVETPAGPAEGTAMGIDSQGALILAQAGYPARITCCHVARYNCSHRITAPAAPTPAEASTRSTPEGCTGR